MKVDTAGKDKKNSGGQGPWKTTEDSPRRGFWKKLFGKNKTDHSSKETASVTDTSATDNKFVKSWQNASPAKHEKEEEPKMLPSSPDLSQIVPLGLTVEEKGDAFRGLPSNSAKDNAKADTTMTKKSTGNVDWVSRVALLVLLVAFITSGLYWKDAFVGQNREASTPSPVASTCEGRFCGVRSIIRFKKRPRRN